MNTYIALSRWVTFVLAVGAGFSVAAIYYAQPLLPLMGQDLNLSITGMGLVLTLTRADTRWVFCFYCHWAIVMTAGH